jgi:DNA segregation ATPase FtsK/SpoIIIE, S-DNA-T family
VWSTRCMDRVRVQMLRKEVLPARDLFPVRVCLRVLESEQVRLILGPGAQDRGARADQISPSLPGVGFVQVDGLAEPVRVRFAYVTDDQIRTLAEGWRPRKSLFFEVIPGGGEGAAA